MYLAHKKLSVGVLVWLSVLEQSVNDLHIVQLMPLPPIISCFIKIQNGSAFLVPAYPGCLGKELIKWVLF